MKYIGNHLKDLAATLVCPCCTVCCTLGASRAFTGEHSQSSCGLNPRSFTVAMFSAYQIIGPVSESRSVGHVSCLVQRWGGCCLWSDGSFRAQTGFGNGSYEHWWHWWHWEPAAAICPRQPQAECELFVLKWRFLWFLMQSDQLSVNRSIYFAPAIRSWFLNFPSQILFIEKDWEKEHHLLHPPENHAT